MAKLDHNHKLCPQCLSTIALNASKCRYCTADLFEFEQARSQEGALASPRGEEEWRKTDRVFRNVMIGGAVLGAAAGLVAGFAWHGLGASLLGAPVGVLVGAIAGWLACAAVVGTFEFIRDEGRYLVYIAGGLCVLVGFVWLVRALWDVAP